MSSKKGSSKNNNDNNSYSLGNVRNVGNCVCDVLQTILDAQDDTNGNGCTSGCIPFVVNPVQTVNTVPFILITKANTLQYGFIDLPGGCEITVYFRINALDDCCATLELLLPNEPRQITPDNECCVPLKEVCGQPDLTLTRTGQCITVDLDCICAIQCFDPAVVMNNGGASALRRS